MAPSRWERGINEPAGEIYIHLGKLAGPPECWKLWKRAGLEKQDILKVLGQQARGPGAARERDMDMAPLLRDPLRELVAESLDKNAVLSAVGVPREAGLPTRNIRCFIVQDEAMRPIVGKGFVAAVQTDMGSLSALDRQIVVLEVDKAVTLRRLHAKRKPMMLVPENREFSRMELTSNVTILGKVAWWLGKA